MRYSARQLVHLAAVIEMKSFSLAARRLGVTQPALTKSIQQLEARVGTALVQRTSNGAQPTHLGHTLAMHGRSIIASEQRASTDVDDWVKGRKGQLLVGAPTTISAYLMPPVISVFLQKHAEASLQLLVTSLDSLSFKLSSNIIDMYVGIVRKEEPPSGIVVIPIYDDELTIFVRKGHPILAEERARIGQLSRYSWALLPMDKFFRRVTEAALLSAGLPAIHAALETDSFDAQLNVVRATNFLCMLPRRMMRHQEGVIALTQFEPLIPARTFTVAIFRREHDETSVLAREFIAEMVELLPCYLELDPRRG